MGRILPLVLCGILFVQAKVYDKVFLVGPTRTYKTIQSAVQACQSSERCDIQVDAGVYNEQVTVYLKRNIWIHGADTTDLPVVRWLDTLSTQPKDVIHANGENNWSFYSERNGVIRVLGESDSIRISHLKIDAIKHFSFQWENVWGSRWQFSGNSGIAISSAHAVQVDHCEVINAFWGIRFKDRNTGGVYANLDLWEIESQITTVTPFSNFGQYGGHLFERNKIHANVWAVYAEQTWDVPATIRYNLIYHNKADTAQDFKCTNRNTCGVPDAAQGDRQYHAGGFLFLKDAMLTPHIIYNNTLYGNPQTIAGYYKAGKNHVVYNNLIDQQSTRLDHYPSQTQGINIFNGYGNAHHNVISSNGRGVFGLMGTSDHLWIAANLANAGTAPVDSFVAPAGYHNFWYQAPEFQSTIETDANFLCPDWSKPNVVRTIQGKAWTMAGSVGTTSLAGVYTAEAQDIGALWQNGSNCRWGGVEDSIGIQLSTKSPILFTNQTDARFQFQINPIHAHDSDFTEVTYHFTAYVDSMPFPISAGVIPQERTPVPGLSGLLTMGHNDIRFTFPRSSLGEYGMMRYSVHAKHSNGKTYVSNIEVVEYRRLKYTLGITLYNQANQVIDTVAKGDTVTAIVKVLDIQMNEISNGLVINPRKKFLHDSRVSWTQDFANPIVGTGTGRFVITSYSAGDELLSIGGIVGEISGADTMKYFITGIAPFYISPSNASQLVITNQSRTAPQNEPLVVTVDVKDVFGDLTDEPIMVRLQSENGTIVGPVPQIVQNRNGKISYTVTPTGSIGQTFTLIATIDGRDVSSEPVTFTIVPPTNRKVIFANKPGNYHFVNGEVIAVQLKLVDGQGALLPIQDFFGLTIRNSAGTITPVVSIYYDSLAALSGQNGNSQGQLALTMPNTGLMTIYIKAPSNLDSSDTYTLQTSNVNFITPTLFDEAEYHVDLPELVYVDQNGRVLETPPLVDTITGYLIPLSIQARINGIVCTQCNDLVQINPSSAYIRFKENSNGPDVQSFALVNGTADFLIYGYRQILDGSYVLSVRDSAASIRHTNLQFRKPPVPQVDSAIVYDTNGDGIADSLVIWYAESIRDSLPDTLAYSWPAVAPASKLVPTESVVLEGSDSILVIRGDLTSYILTQGTGKLFSTYQDNEGQWWTQRIDIIERIGPVLKRVALVQSWTGAQDTLFATFSEPLDTSAIQGSAFVLNSNSSMPIATRGLQIDDTTWVFMVDRNRVRAGDNMQLSESGPVADQLGNPPHRLNLSVVVSLIRRPIPPSQNGNFFQDRNGDGTLDHVIIKLLGPVDQNYLDQELDSITFTWVDSSGHVIRLTALASEFSINPQDSTQIVWTVPNPNGLYPFLTQIDTTEFGAYGRATMYASLDGEDQSVIPVRMSDGMPPVIRQAVLRVGIEGGDSDQLTISFSEPVDWASANMENLFEIQVQGELRTLRFSESEWIDSSTVVLTFNRDIRYDQRPSSQDSIRIISGALRDAHGIAVPDAATYSRDNGPGTTRPFKMIIGDFRFKLTTVTKSSFHPEDPTLVQADPMDVHFREFKADVDKKRDLGVIADVGSLDLRHSVQRTIKDRYFSKDESQLIEDIEVDLSQLTITLDLSLYTNLSGFVAQKSITIPCTDSRFSVQGEQASSDTPGDCIENPAQIYLQWNFKSTEGRMIGTGAYFAKMRFKVSYKGNHPVTVTQLDKIETWGVIRTQSSGALR